MDINVHHYFHSPGEDQLMAQLLRMDAKLNAILKEELFMNQDFEDMKSAIADEDTKVEQLLALAKQVPDLLTQLGNAPSAADIQAVKQHVQDEVAKIETGLTPTAPGGGAATPPADTPPPDVTPVQPI